MKIRVSCIIAYRYALVREICHDPIALLKWKFQNLLNIAFNWNNKKTQNSQVKINDSTDNKIYEKPEFNRLIGIIERKNYEFNRNQFGFEEECWKQLLLPNSSILQAVNLVNHYTLLEVLEKYATQGICSSGLDHLACFKIMPEGE